MVAGTELQGDSSVRQDRQNHPQKGRALLWNQGGGQVMPSVVT